MGALTAIQALAGAVLIIWALKAHTTILDRKDPTA